MRKITKEMRDEAARWVSRLPAAPAHSDTREALRRIAISPEVESIDEEDWHRLIDDANFEREEAPTTFIGITGMFNALAEGCDGTLQPDAAPITPKDVVTLVNAMHCMSEAELRLLIDRMVASQKAGGWPTFAEFVWAMIQEDKLKEDMAAVMARTPQLTINGILGPDDYRRLEYISEDDDVQAMFRQDRDMLMQPRDLEAFAAARRWLGENTNHEEPMRTVFSQGLTHLIGPDTGYMVNGLCIAAALAEGCTVERGQLGDAWIDVPLTPEMWERYSQLDPIFREEKKPPRDEGAK
jgi:hypothetical protein